MVDKWNLKLGHWWSETDWAGVHGVHGKSLVTYCLRHGTAPERRGPLGRPAGIDGEIILEWILQQWDVSVWTGYVWLSTGTGGMLLLTW